MRHLSLDELLPLWPRQLICKIRQAQEQSGKDRTRPVRPDLGGETGREARKMPEINGGCGSKALAD